jgi:hypothetical protein
LQELFQPKNTPTVVASVYVSSALLDAYEITNNQSYLMRQLVAAILY